MSGPGRIDRLAELLAKIDPDRAIDEELASHVELRARQLVDGGMDADDALAEALIRFGDVPDVKAECARSDRRRLRRSRRTEAVRGLFRDLRLAVRSARRSPGPSALAIVAIALGTGITAAVFAVAHGVLLEDLPYPDAGRIAGIHTVDAAGTDRFGLFAFQEITALADVPDVDLAGYSIVRPAVTGDGFEPTEATVARTTAGFFRVLGAPVLHGRLPSPDEARSGLPVAVLGHAFWISRFGADPEAIGRRIEIEDVAHTIVGVLPAWFAMPEDARIWRPLTVAEREDDDREVYAVARLATGVTAERATAALDARLGAFQDELGVPAAERRTVRAGSIRDSLTHAVRGPLWLLVGAAGLVLLVACVNVSNLLLARAESRRDQAALRGALGADRIRIARAHLAESLVLAGTGGILGLLLGRLALPLLIRLAPEGTPRLADVSFDGRVVGTMAAAVAATALLSGLVPAWRASRAAPAGLSSHGRRTVGGGTAILDGFVSGQIALSTALAVGALLLGASFVRLMEIDRGFSHERAVVVPLALSADVRRQGALVAYERILEEARALPGVVGAHLAYHAPDEGRGINLRLIQPEGLREDAIGEGSIIAVTPGYFETLEIDVLDGRAFRASDDELGAPVAVVSASFARRLVPTDVEAVGWRFTHAAGPGGDTVELEIVGVVADVVPDPSEPPPPILYVPFAQLAFGHPELIVRTTGPPAAILPLLRERIWTIDPGVPLDAARTLEEAVSRSVASPRFYMFVVGAFAALAVLLAAIGTYSVAAYGVSRREREIGVRAALGADARRIVGQVFGAGLRPVGIGIAVGLAAAAALSRALSGLLFGVTALEPWVYIAVAAWLAVVALAAVAVPALRAARTDPLLALRSD